MTFQAPEATAIADPRRMTYDDYLALPHEGQLIEWVEGEVIYHISPPIIHQKVVGYLY